MPFIELSDVEDGYKGVDFKVLKRLEKPIIEYLAKHGLACSIAIKFWDKEVSDKAKS